MSLDEYALYGESAMLKRHQENEASLLPSGLRHKYLSDPEEMEYWSSVFGSEEIKIIPENDIPF